MAPLRGLPLLLRPGLAVALTPPALDRDRFCTVVAVADDPSGAARVRFSGIDGLGAAEAVSGCFVLASASDIELAPLVAADDDLLGREVVDARHGFLGRIVEVMETPAHDVWVVDGGAYGEVLVPVVEAALDAIPDEGPIPTHVMEGLVGL